VDYFSIGKTQPCIIDVSKKKKWLTNIAFDSHAMVEDSKWRWLITSRTTSLSITQPFCIFATMEEIKCPKFKIYLGSSHLLDLYIGPFREVQHFSFNVAISNAIIDNVTRNEWIALATIFN
jgi:hypothetical protein